MQVDWVLKTSKLAGLLAVIISLTPLVVILFLEQQLRYLWLVCLSLPWLYWLLIKQFNLRSKNHKALLSYQNGIWFYRDSKTSVFGSLSIHSFAYSSLIFLQIKTEHRQIVDLWLFSDNITGKPSKWRQLHSCFNLSDRI